MKSEDRDRIAALQRLLALSASHKELAEDLAKFDFDYEGTGVVLTPTCLMRILHRYIQGELVGADVEAWANMVEGRDDVHIPDESSDEIESVLHELANPYLTYPLETERARYLLGKLAE